MGIRAVFFDAEGTLLHIYPSVGAVYARVLAEFGHPVPEEELERRVRKRWPEFKRYFRDFSPEICRRTWRRIFREAVEPWLADPGEELFSAVYEAFARPDSFRLAPGTEEGLRFLRERGVKAAVLSNWDERLFRVLEAFGLDRYFERVFVACERGFGKPEPEFYLLACAEMAVQPGEALMIGDDPELDCEAALRVGLRARLYRGEDIFRIIKEEVDEGAP
ncbi:HAD family hydrolase [Thermosulfurimonas sp. F29]|uniref:HAD family hydrolase n=1 Tax=Thermosulfurimonas sp. F29 TaxID=2867247 RepID=UPI001C836565|nr:HAD-IA family hydrolase [Thermosulfurimonas sp. F29]MBX6422090.1 HAD family hydrolase [Thermosulfurimonas sp. F29]